MKEFFKNFWVGFKSFLSDMWMPVIGLLSATALVAIASSFITSELVFGVLNYILDRVWLTCTCLGIMGLTGFLTFVIALYRHGKDIRSKNEYE